MLVLDAVGDALLLGVPVGVLVTLGEGVLDTDGLELGELVGLGRAMNMVLGHSAREGPVPSATATVLDVSGTPSAHL